MNRSCVFLVAAFTFAFAGPSPAASYQLQALKEPPPADLASPVREALAADGCRIVDAEGKPLADFWFRKEVPEAPPPKEKQIGAKFEALAEGTLLGAARYHQKHYDFKDKPFPAGIYTLRLGLQPTDGDHQGVSETRDFALLCPASADKDLSPIPTKESVKLSNQASGTKHPVIVWLRPMKGTAPEKLALVHEKEHDHQVLDFQIALQGQKEKAVRLGLVVVGVAPEN